MFEHAHALRDDRVGFPCTCLDLLKINTNYINNYKYMLWMSLTRFPGERK